MLSSDEIISETRRQLAIDLNCAPGDFDRDGFVFCEAKDNPGRRPFPRGERHFEMLTMGGAVIISATPDIQSFIRERLSGELDKKSRADAFSMPFVRGHGIYYLPDGPRPLPPPDGIAFDLVEQPEIAALYALDGFHNALSYDINALRPDVLAVIARKDGVVAGVAGVSADCEMLWQVGIDVLPEYRRFGIAAALTNQLTLEILRRGKIPYYGTGVSKVASQRVAHRAGYRVAWVCAYKGVFDGMMTAATG